jgi:phospholipid-binding lipoprotein MlaA
MRIRYPLFLFVLIVCTGLISGCASQSKSSVAQDLRSQDVPAAESKDVQEELTEEEEFLMEDDFEEFEDDQGLYSIADPIEPFNRFMFQFNDMLYTGVLRPVSLGYRKITPQPVRTGVKNFFHNLTTPVRFTNCILQGKGQAATAEFASFVLNTIFGVLGFGDITKGYPELNPDTEDLGQTLGRYRIGDGFYLVLPFFGSSTVRDAVGRIGDSFLDPANYVEPKNLSIGIRAYDTVNDLSFSIEDIDALKKAALDPYQAARDFYIQSRQTKIRK